VILGVGLKGQVFLGDPASTLECFDSTFVLPNDLAAFLFVHGPPFFLEGGVKQTGPVGVQAVGERDPALVPIVVVLIVVAHSRGSLKKIMRSREMQVESRNEKKGKNEKMKK
jgi:hypothetical protein